MQTAASRAGWPLPKRIAAVACRATEPDVLAARLGPRVIWAAVEGFICLLIPEPDEDLHAQLVESLHDMNAAVGPVTTLNQAATGWRWAYRAQTLIDRGIVGLSGVVITDDHLTTLLLHSDEELLAALRRRWLAPIEATPARSRQGMADTLLAWLSRHGNIHAAAADLHVHPHTVRYRLEKLRHLYGDALDDPDARLELQLALRAAGVSVASATQALSQASSAPV